MKRRRISARERVDIWNRAKGVCHICGQKIDGGRETWEVEHVIPLELGGDETKGSENLQPAHVKCHRLKTHEDAGKIAKAKRLEQRSIGISRQPARQLPGSRGSKWKQKIGGQWVRRGEE